MYFSQQHEEPGEGACVRAAVNPEKVVIHSVERYFQDPFIYVSLFCNNTMVVELEARFKSAEESAQKKRPQSQGVERKKGGAQASEHGGSARSTGGYEAIRQRVDELSNNRQAYGQFMKYMRKMKKSRLKNLPHGSAGQAGSPVSSTIKKNIMNIK